MWISITGQSSIQHRVHDGDGGAGEAGGVDEQAVGGGAGFLHPVDELAFVVGLAEVQQQPGAFRGAVAAGADGGEILSAIRPLGIEAIEVGIGGR